MFPIRDMNSKPIKKYIPININILINLYNLCQYESGGTFLVGFIIEYLEKLNAIILIIYSSRPFNVVCEHRVFALWGSD